MAAPPLLRTLPLFRPNICLYNHHHHHLTITATIFSLHRPSCSSGSSRSEEDIVSSASTSELLKVNKPPKLLEIMGDLSNRKWEEKEDQILKDIEPVILLAKEILHSDRYLDGQRLTSDDEKFVMERLLAYHPRCEDKIGCGLDSIMVDRHPQFRHTRCLFVVRTDGGWIDFSYQKCLREYIRKKYPSHAERFIREHLKRGSG